uniref:hypothetical protein n=1 Tax=Burkholderia diffusa TaxID=488732 RepID=UPI001CC4FA06|nr:hypothetical protein [Burkholderia diffusa]
MVVKIGVRVDGSRDPQLVTRCRVAFRPAVPYVLANEIGFRTLVGPRERAARRRIDRWDKAHRKFRFPMPAEAGALSADYVKQLHRRPKLKVLPCLRGAVFREFAGFAFSLKPGYHKPGHSISNFIDHRFSHWSLLKAPHAPTMRTV